jgi:hypothetical protein
MQCLQHHRIAALLAVVSLVVFATAAHSAAQTYSDELPPRPAEADSRDDNPPARDDYQAPNRARAPQPRMNAEPMPRMNGEPIAMPRGIPEEHRHWLGVWLSPAHPVLRGHMNLGNAGLEVQDVFAGTPAHHAGLKPNDVLFEASGADLTRTLRSRADLGAVVLATAKANQPVHVRFLRNGQEQTLELVPALRPAPVYGFAAYPQWTEPFHDEWAWDDMPAFTAPRIVTRPFFVW